MAILDAFGVLAFVPVRHLGADSSYVKLIKWSPYHSKSSAVDISLVKASIDIFGQRMGSVPPGSGSCHK